MAKVNELLSERLKGGQQTSKMAALARQTASGNLTSFSGVFSVVELTENEKQSIEILLKEHSNANHDVSEDLHSLISITSEVKAINNQAAILHGERIKKAQTILMRYRDGAFTRWLISTYGNRQTPYNLLQYFEFYEQLPKNLRPQLESMPRQAVYTLASRNAPFERKQAVIESYKNETKQELLKLIRKNFPLATEDKRRQNLGESLVNELRLFFAKLKEAKSHLSDSQKNQLRRLLGDIQFYIK